MLSQHLTLIPRISEKSYALAQQNIYTFKAPKNANKNDIAAAVAKQYDVTVASVNIVIAKGKTIRTVRKGRPIIGRRTDVKKAYVALAEGSSIKMFDEEKK